MGADVGMHFFNPVAVLPLVELVRTPQTDDETLATAWAFAEGLRKRPVLVADAPAFVVNRVLTRLMSVVLDALEHGTVDEADEAILALGLPMAPSVLLQMVGPRVANHVLETLHEAYPDRFPLSPTLANYAEGSDEIVVREQAPLSREQILEGALEAVADEIHHLLEEGVVAEAADVDTCLLLGAGWPVLPRRDHEAPRPDRDLGADVRAPARRGRRGGARDMSDNWRIRIQPREAEQARRCSSASGSTSAPTRRSGSPRSCRVTASRSPATTTRSSSTPRPSPQAEQARGIVEAELRRGAHRGRSRRRALARGRGALGRRAAGRRPGSRRSSSTAMRRGRCGSSFPRTARPTSSPTSSRARATTSLAAGAT